MTRTVILCLATAIYNDMDIAFTYELYKNRIHTPSTSACPYILREINMIKEKQIIE